MRRQVQVRESMLLGLLVVGDIEVNVDPVVVAKASGDGFTWGVGARSYAVTASGMRWILDFWRRVTS